MNQLKSLLLAIALSLSVFHLFPATEAVILPIIPSTVFSITSYGATVGSTDNTKAIQAAIDACTVAGGGMVNIPAGTFLCGPLTLKAKVNLHISKGAILRLLPYGSGNGTPAGSYPNNGTVNTYNSFIAANKVDNIKVSGSGTIDGQGSPWWTAYRTLKAAGIGMERPCLITYNSCNYAQIDSVTIQNAPNVHISVGKYCSNSTISNVNISAPETSTNTDGIDVWSPYVNIINCNIACGDDNIAMNNNSQYITIKKCTFGTGHGCSIGSYASNISNILVDSCIFNGTDNGARFKTNRDRGGVEEYITYSNCTMEGVSTPFALASYYPKTPAIPDTASSAPITSSTPTWRHIVFKNIIVTGAGNAGNIWGLPELLMTDIVFDNVKINASAAMKFYNAKDVVFKNGSSITIPTSGKIKGKVIDLFNANVSGIDLTTGQPIINSLSNLTISNNFFRLSANLLQLQNSADVDVYTVTGLKVISSKECNELSLAGLLTGSYIINIKTKSSVNSFKIIKQ